MKHKTKSKKIVSFAMRTVWLQRALIAIEDCLASGDKAALERWEKIYYKLAAC